MTVFQKKKLLLIRITSGRGFHVELTSSNKEEGTWNSKENCS